MVRLYISVAFRSLSKPFYKYVWFGFPLLYREWNLFISWILRALWSLRSTIRTLHTGSIAAVRNCRQGKLSSSSISPKDAQNDRHALTNVIHVLGISMRPSALKTYQYLITYNTYTSLRLELWISHCHISQHKTLRNDMKTGRASLCSRSSNEWFNKSAVLSGALMAHFNSKNKHKCDK